MPEYDATAVDATAGPGATAVLHGMLATLTEVLDGLDRRLAGMEAAMEGARLEPLIERVSRLEERLDDRLAEVVGGRDRTAETLAAISSGVGHLAARLDQLAEVDDEPAAEPEPDRIGPLAEAVRRLEQAVGEVAARLDALPVPEPAPHVDLTSVEAAVARVGRTLEERIDALPVPEIPELPAPVDLRPLEERLAVLATSVDAVGFGVAGLTDALRSTDEGDGEEPDVVGAVVQEAENIRSAVAGLAQAVAAVRSDVVRHVDDAVGRLADRPVEVDLDRILAVLESHASGVRDEVSRLDTLLRGQVAEVAGRTGSITEVIGRLDGRLHEVVDGVRALQRRVEGPVRLTAVNGE